MHAEYDADRRTVSSMELIKRLIKKKKMCGSFRRYLIVSTTRPNCLVAYKRRILIGRHIIENCAYPRHLCKSASFAYRGRMCVVAIALSGQISARPISFRAVLSLNARFLSYRNVYL